MSVRACTESWFTFPLPVTPSALLDPVWAGKDFSGGRIYGLRWWNCVLIVFLSPHAVYYITVCQPHMKNCYDMASEQVVSMHDSNHLNRLMIVIVIITIITIILF